MSSLSVFYSTFTIKMLVTDFSPQHMAKAKKTNSSSSIKMSQMTWFAV